MAIRTKESNGRITLIATETVIGVKLVREIDGTKVRPSSVTAAIATTAGAGEDPDFVLLYSGPKGGFTQQFKAAAGQYEVNDAVDALITDA